MAPEATRRPRTVTADARHARVQWAKVFKSCGRVPRLPILLQCLRETRFSTVVNYPGVIVSSPVRLPIAAAARPQIFGRVCGHPIEAVAPAMECEGV